MTDQKAQPWEVVGKDIVGLGDSRAEAPIGDLGMVCSKAEIKW